MPEERDQNARDPDPSEHPIAPNVRAPDAGEDPPAFHAALAFQMRRHGDTGYRLAQALSTGTHKVYPSKIRGWAAGKWVPVKEGLFLLDAMEVRWGLPAGYFRSRLPPPRRREQTRHVLGSDREIRALAVHLPDDFRDRPAAQQAEILAWVRRTIVRGTTDYRGYQLEKAKDPYAIRFESKHLLNPEAVRARNGLRPGTRLASPTLMAEVDAMMAYKTSELSPDGRGRRFRWKPITALLKAAQLGLFLGALAADPAGPNEGAGAPHADLSLGLLAMTGPWKWYLAWRRRRRGFYTNFETHLLESFSALADPQYGWMPRNPQLADALRPIPGVVTAEEIAAARRDWRASCREFREFARQTLRDLRFAQRVHHDHHEPIMCVLEADSPVTEYNRIADEILRQAPCPRALPRDAAESARAYLMVRLGLHLGFRPKNMRQLLVCPRGGQPTSEGRLQAGECGELRWSDRLAAWEVFVPTIAFKNQHSSFFSEHPYQMALPDIGGLYAHIDAYLTRHRPVLLGRAKDPGALFIKTARTARSSVAYDRNHYFLAWQWLIQRYGVYNPYTGRGAIKGLLPHGPSAVRAVLATHVLKQTGSYEKASYAIQDTPEMVMKHYGRFLPGSKSQIAAAVVNEVWA